jgi:hypothetical protein
VTEWPVWLDDVAADLDACGQPEIAERIRSIPEPGPATDGDAPRATGDPAEEAPTLRPRLTGAARIVHGVRRRIRPPHVATGPDDSLFALFAREDISAVVSVLVRDAGVSDALERLVANDPADSTLVRLGRDGIVPPSPSPGGVLGRRSGMGSAAVAVLAAVMRAVVVAGPEGAAHLRADDLADAAALILIEPDSRGHHRLRSELAASAAWERADEDFRRCVLRTLAPAPGVDVWLPVSEGGER